MVKKAHLPDRESCRLSRLRDELRQKQALVRRPPQNRSLQLFARKLEKMIA